MCFDEAQQGITSMSADAAAPTELITPPGKSHLCEQRFLGLRHHCGEAPIEREQRRECRSAGGRLPGERNLECGIGFSKVVHCAPDVRSPPLPQANPGLPGARKISLTTMLGEALTLLPLFV
jgi:hypothetical protein